MDQAAVLVDAGYLLAAGGSLCVGSPTRSDLVCDYAAFHQGLRSLVINHAALPILRTYWYDAAPNAQPTSEQRLIEALPNVKLRLGRLTAYGQKGVDSKITRDLMTLARERSIARAYLLAGDEDLREGMIAAQDLGVQVILLGIPGAQNNQALTLVNEADEHVVLDAAFLQPFFTAAQGLMFSGILIGIGGLDEVAEACADEWCASTTPADWAALAAQAPRLPFEIDSALLKAVQRHVGSLRADAGARVRARQAFHARVIQVSTSQVRTT